MEKEGELPDWELPKGSLIKTVGLPLDPVDVDAPDNGRLGEGGTDSVVGAEIIVVVSGTNTA